MIVEGLRGMQMDPSLDGARDRRQGRVRLTTSSAATTG